MKTAYAGAASRDQAGVAVDLIEYALSPAGQAAATNAANGGSGSIPPGQLLIEQEELQTISYC